MFNAHALEEICTLYSDNAVFWGTYAPKLITGPEGIREYFASAFSQNLNAEVAPDSLLAQTIESVHLCSGEYSVFKPSPAGLIEFPARFTLMAYTERNQWRIANHHSSLNPDSKSGGD